MIANRRAAPCGILKRVTKLALGLTTAAALLLSPAETPAHLAAGEAALAEGRWADAELSFRLAIGEQGDSPEAQIGLARALAGGGDSGRAVGGLMRAAERWIGDGAFAEAERILELAVALGPHDPAVLTLLGRARVLGRRYVAAEEPLARVVEMGGAGVDALLYYGAALWENGRLDRAEEISRRAVAVSGGAFPARYQLARLLLWQSRFAEAAELLRACAREAPEALDVRFDLARALEGAGELEESLEAYRRAAVLAPEHSELRYGLAMALLRSGQRAAAEAELETYRRLYDAEQRRTLDRGVAEARIAHGRELLRQGRPGEALEHLRRLPESADSLAAIAAALRAGGDLEGAIDELGRAIQLEPGRADLRALLNEARLELLRRP